MINMIKMLVNVNKISKAFYISSSIINLSRFLFFFLFFINENASIITSAQFCNTNSNNELNKKHTNSNYTKIVEIHACSHNTAYSSFNTSHTITEGNVLISEWLCYLNFIGIFIAYPGISNPGPKSKVTYNGNNGITVFYQNVQGLIPFSSLSDQHPNLDSNKIFELHAFIYKNNPDVIILNETWLKPSILNTEILPNDYNVYRLDRSLQSHPIDLLNPNKFRRNGGGVLIAVNNKLTLQSKLIPVKCAAELLAVELTLPDCTKIIISTCYRVGTLGISNCKEIMNTLNKLSRKKMLRKFVVIGDFNLKNVNWNAGNGIISTNSLENEFLNGFADLGLLQCIDAPTHNKGKTLDILLTKSKQYITDLKVIDTERYCISDHFAVTFKISQTVTRKPRVKRTCFNYEKANWNDLNNDLNNINWDITLDCQEPDIMWSNFKNAVLDKVNVHIPKFTIKSEYQPPWFDSECYAKCKDKDKLHKIYKTKKTLTSEIKFKTARKEFKTLIKSKMRANLVSDNRNILHKKIWSHVKSTTKLTRIPEVVSYGGKTASDSIEKAKMFNEYFRRQFSEASNYSINIDFQNDRSFDIDFSESRIKSILSALNVNKAQGPDGINGAVLKHCSDSLVYPLSKMFNLVYNVGCIPSEWKTSNVVPVHKKDDKSDIENYRPISLISLVMKVFERVLYEELLNRTEDKIDPRQHGFLRNKSCNTNLLSFTNSVAFTLHDKIGVDVVYFDFAKAFDTVTHDLILNKLKNQYKIDGNLLKLFVNYLQGRKQRVILDNSSSEYIDVLSGVPQGSILGPLLFILFINDIYMGLDNDTNIGLYADDTKIWRNIYSEHDCAILQKDINTLYDWSIKNRMHFHPEKCKILQIHNNEPLCTKLLPLAKHHYFINGEFIEFIECQRDLGVLVNSRFKWDDHQQKVLNKAHQMLGITKRTCHFIIDRRKRRSLYLSLVRSQFEHCSSIWRPNTDTEISIFEKLQKKAVKWIFNEQNYHYDVEVYLNRCSQLKITPMSTFFDIRDLILFHKIVYERIPISLPTFIKPYTGYGRLRNANLDSQSFISDAFSNVLNSSSRSPFYKSFFHKVLHTWNRLPFLIRSIPNEPQFKHKVTDFLWSEILNSVGASIPIS